jgi:16S rRNA (uracil1498-N3)-methyltransferase
VLPRLYVDSPLQAGTTLALPAAAARHAQVLRLQPGSELTLFDGRGGEWSARIDTMARREVTASAISHRAIERELSALVTLALVMPSAERMDFVVEKATELGASAIAPLLSERSVLRLAGERADKRRAHWQAIAVAACEQCGRNRVPEVRTPLTLTHWLGALDACGALERRWLLGWRDARPWPVAAAAADGDSALSIVTLSGAEGGFTAEEETLAAARGFVAVNLGPRVLRADTAPLAVMAALSLGLRQVASPR